MRIYRLIFTIFFIVSGLLTQVECRKTKAFDINGIWSIDQTLECQDGTTINQSISFSFTGSKTDGTVIMYPNNPPGALFSGSYKVTGESVSFIYSYGHGIIFFTYVYTGRIYPELNKITGRVERKVLQSGVITFLCSGSFVAAQ